MILISMLRGINLGSHHRITMEALKAVYELLGLQNPHTYVQSGNVIFGTKERDLTRLAKRIENAIELSFGFHSDVILRTSSELRHVIARNPFSTRRDIDPSKLLVTFLATDPEPEPREKMLKLKVDPEELWVDGRELYIYFPNGMGRTKLQLTAIERTLKIPGTGRNWNSVTKMLELAQRLEASQ